MTTTVKKKKQLNMKDFTKKIIGALCILFMINSTQVQNELDIIGNWEVDSIYATASVSLSSEELDQLMLMANLGLISAEDFLDEMGFPMPTSPQEWDALATNGITMEIPEDEIDIAGFAITESVFGILVDEEGVMPIEYSWSTDSTISFETTSEEFPFTEFTVVSATNDNLIMSSAFTIEEDDEQINYNIIFYCSSAEEFTLGCTDPTAENYDMDANVDDGSCEYSWPCSSNELLLELNDEAGDGWEGSELIINGTSYTLEDGDQEWECIEFTECLDIYTIEGEYMDEASWLIFEYNFEVIGEDNQLPSITTIEVPGGGCNTINIEEISTETNSLIKVIDILGREHKEHDKGMVLFYIYENGKVIKKINAE